MRSLDSNVSNLPGDLYLEVSALRHEMQTEFAAVGSEIDGLRADVRAGDEETRGYMRVLYEDLVERITRIGEGAQDSR